jgi:hypothetical protein
MMAAHPEIAVAGAGMRGLATIGESGSARGLKGLPTAILMAPVIHWLVK